MKKYFKNKYLSPRSPTTRTPERVRDDRLDCNQQQQQQLQDLLKTERKRRLCFILIWS